MILSLFQLLFSVVVAMPIQSSPIKNDLKMKTVTLGKKEFDACGIVLVRKAQTLTYSCSLAIPVKGKISQLQNIASARKLPAVFGGARRDVLIDISEDARILTLTTSFDATGVDFEISKFNDDFFTVYAQVAQIVISEALKKQPIKFEVLESL